MTPDTLGERLTAALHDLNMTNAELGRRSGVTPQNIGMIRNGVSRGNLEPETLFALADALGVHARWLAFGTGPMKNTEGVDAGVLGQILGGLSAELDASGVTWPPARVAAVAARFYANWARTGELPDLALAVSLLADQNVLAEIRE